MRRRWWFLMLFLPLYTGVMMWVASLIFQMLGRPIDEWDNMMEDMVQPREWLDALTEEWWWLLIGIPALILTVSQTLFLLPICSRGLRRTEHGTSLRVSVAMAGVVAAALTLGFGFAAWNLLHLLQFQLGSAPVLDFELELRDHHWWVVMGIVAVSWVIWSVILLAFASAKPDRWVGTRLLGLLLGGTILEVIIVLPLDIMVRRKTDCYCSTGTFYALCLSAWALLWLAGPGAIIAVLSKRRRLWWDTHCANCGYEKGPSPGARCPECGFEWGSDKVRPA